MNTDFNYTWEGQRVYFDAALNSDPRTNQWRGLIDTTGYRIPAAAQLNTSIYEEAEVVYE